MEKKYVKQKSLTWWVSFVMLLCGIALAADETWSAGSFGIFLRSIWGDVPAATLVSGGLFGIGVRAAIGAGK